MRDKKTKDGMVDRKVAVDMIGDKANKRERKGKRGDLGTKRGKEEMVAICRAAGPEIIERLKDIALSPKKNKVQTRLLAMKELLDRGYGKPKETVDTGVTVKIDIPAMLRYKQREALPDAVIPEEKKEAEG